MNTGVIYGNVQGHERLLWTIMLLSHNNSTSFYSQKCAAVRDLSDGIENEVS